MENPKIRFKGFTKDWEQRKLGDVFKEYSEKNHTELSALTIIQGGGTVKREDSDRNLMYDTSNLSNYKMVRKDDFIVHLRSFEGGLEKSSLDGIISPAYHTFHSDMADSRFYYPYFRSYEFIKHKLVSHVYGIRDGRSIDIDGMKTIEIPYTSIEEQRKIGDYLDCLDHLITLHQRKCEQTKKLKKYMLQKMFPQNGAKVPEIRFDGFTYDWEQRKLGDMGSTYTGLSGKTKEDFGHGDAKFITYMNVFSNPVANLDMTESVEIDSKQNCVKAGDVFFTTSSETPEEVGMSSVMPENADNIYLNSFCFGYRPTEKFDLNYLAYVLRTESFRKEMTFLAQGISRYNISKNKVMEVEIPIPSLDEQSRVGQYFKNLDTLITLHQRKCDELKKMKKYMLQNMFI